MKKAISFLLAALLVLSGVSAAFAAGTAVPSDVKGTKYEAAVTELMEKIGLAGYTDGTFRPENSINRAEVCTILGKALQPSDSALKSAPDVFKDMSGSDIKWALEYVNYAASRGIVKGYDGGLFRPASIVTYNEMATMLVNALGYTDKELTGAWPESHISKAKELGIFKDVDIAGRGNSGATRGDVALMTAAVADKIIEQGKNLSDESNTATSGGAVTDKPSTSGGAVTDKPTTSGGAVTPPTETPSGDQGDSGDSASKDVGGTFGLINDVDKASGGNGGTVQQIEFFTDGKKVDLLTTEADMVSAPQYDGSLYYIKYDGNGRITAAYSNPAKADAEHYEDLAGSGGWADVKSIQNRVVTLADGTEVAISRDADFYCMAFMNDSIDSYEIATLHDIESGAKIRAYDITDDGTAAADVVVIVTKSDLEKHGAAL